MHHLGAVGIEPSPDQRLLFGARGIVAISQYPRHLNHSLVGVQPPHFRRLLTRLRLSSPKKFRCNRVELGERLSDFNVIRSQCYSVLQMAAAARGEQRLAKDIRTSRLLAESFSEPHLVFR